MLLTRQAGHHEGGHHEASNFSISEVDSTDCCSSSIKFTSPAEILGFNVFGVVRSTPRPRPCC